MSKLITLGGLVGSKKKKILLSMPSHRGVPMRETRISIGNAMKYLVAQGIDVSFQDTAGANIAGNRNEGCHELLKGSFDYLMFIDDDMVCEPDHIHRLLAHDKPIVGGLCVKKVFPYHTTVMRWNPALELYDMLIDFPLNELIEVDATGTAFVLIKREVIEAIQPPWFAFPPRNGSVVGEDLYFCEQARKAGYKLYIDTGVQIGHLGLYAYTVADSLAMKDALEQGLIPKSYLYSAEDVRKLEKRCAERLAKTSEGNVSQVA